MTVSEKIKALRVYRWMSQQKLADISWMTRLAISQREQWISEFFSDEIVQIGKSLCTDPAQFFDKKDSITITLCNQSFLY